MPDQRLLVFDPGDFIGFHKFERDITDDFCCSLRGSASSIVVYRSPDKSPEGNDDAGDAAPCAVGDSSSLRLLPTQGVASSVPSSIVE